MHFSDLPISRPEIITANGNHIAHTLGSILGNSQDDVFYSLPVEGMPCSVRLLSREKVENGMCVNEQYHPSVEINVRVLADELMQLTEPDSVPPARYSPPIAPEGKSMGWEIRSAKIEGESVAIACAVWV